MFDFNRAAKTNTTLHSLATSTYLKDCRAHDKLIRDVDSLFTKQMEEARCAGGDRGEQNLKRRRQLQREEVR